MNRQTIAQQEWRKFEQMVSHLEKLLTPKGYTFKSPDKLVDNDTGELREVDCSITHEASGMIVSMECRKRGKRQDVLWIEQLVCKKDSLGLAGTIAVCSKGFSKSAQAKAQKRGIALKTYSEIADPSFLFDFRDGVQIRHLVQRGPIQQLSYEIDDDEPSLSDEAQARVISSIEIAQEATTLLRNVITGEVATVGQIIKACLSQIADAAVGVTFKNCQLEFPPKTIVLEPAGNFVYVRQLTMSLKIEVTTQAMENPKLFRYGGDQSVTLKVASADAQSVEHGSINFQMVFSTEKVPTPHTE